MRNFFDKQLEELHGKLIFMGEKCEKAIKMAIDAFLDEFSNLDNSIGEVADIEKEINDLERD